MKLKRRMIAAMCLLAALFGSWTTATAVAVEMTGSDAEAVRAVVQAQLDAFAEDDAAKAFELATVSTRTLLGSPESFLQMIKQEYPAIYRHRGALFTPPEMMINGMALQVVRLTDHDDLVWVAIYRMQREQDGNWKIDGCTLLRTASTSI
jgi:hypothetical protein